MPDKDTSLSDIIAAGELPRISFNPFYIGFRYLLAKKLSFLAILGVMISVGTLVVVMSVMTGFRQQLMSIIRGYHSDLTVESKTTRLYGMKDWQEVAEHARQVEHVEHAAPFLEGYALMKFEGSDHMEHVFFRGIDPDLESGVTNLDKYLQRGTDLEDLKETHVDVRNPRAGKIPSCIVGNAMAELVNADFKRSRVQVILVTATRQVEARFRKFRIYGTFKTGRYDWDRSVIVVPLDVAQKFVDSESGVSGLSVRLDDFANHEQAIEGLREKLGSGYMFTTWKEKEKNFLEAVAMERFLMAIILSFIVILAGFCIAAILAFTVQEKRRDIGILKAVGFSSGMIGSVFLVHGLTIGLIGAVLGSVGGRLFTDNINAIESFIESSTGYTPFPETIYYFNSIPTDDGLMIPLAVAGWAIFCSLIFSLLPALKAARLDPVQTLRFE